MLRVPWGRANAFGRRCRYRVRLVGGRKVRTGEGWWEPGLGVAQDVRRRQKRNTHIGVYIMHLIGHSDRWRVGRFYR